MTGGKARPAISLIKYDEKLRNAMEFVFGSIVSFNLNQFNFYSS